MCIYIYIYIYIMYSLKKDKIFRQSNYICIIQLYIFPFTFPLTVAGVHVSVSQWRWQPYVGRSSRWSVCYKGEACSHQRLMRCFNQTPSEHQTKHWKDGTHGSNAVQTATQRLPKIAANFKRTIKSLSPWRDSEPILS